MTASRLPSPLDTEQPTMRFAIIGMGGIFPDAPTLPQFWDNICRNHVAIGNVPKNRWDPALYLCEDRTAADKTYSQIGGFIREWEFDARQFRIPPKSLPCIDELQKMVLTAVAEALRSAKLEVFEGKGDGRAFARARTAVILGNSMGGEAEDRTSLRIWLAEVKDAFRLSAKEQGLSLEVVGPLLDAFDARFLPTLPRVTEDSMPGEISNCITGRVANAFDFRGPNFTCDAACASSMAALQTGMAGLRAGEFDLAIVGGADRSMDPPTYVKFSKIGALSATMSAPFDRRADGFVMGEGVGILVLKRLEDAERDHDPIVAVICSVGAASDGRGKGMTAPNPRGQKLAVERAWAQAKLDPTSVGLIEAHGTSTPVGDNTEIQVLTEVLEAAGAAPRAVPIGSVKSMIGHLKSAAGAASLIKSAFALQTRTLPPTANFETSAENSPLSRGFLAVNTQKKDWPKGRHPRRIGVSSFGFGGTNFHVVMEEYMAQDPKDSAEAGAESGSAQSTQELNTQSGRIMQASPAGRVSSPRDAKAVLEEVIALFAEKTGYAPDELAPDHHLEADLGIDTVKQAEIMAVLRERYGLDAATPLAIGELTNLAAIAQALVAATPMRPPSHVDVASAPAPASQIQVVAFSGTSLAALLDGAKSHLGDPRSRWARAPDQALTQAPARLAYVAESREEAVRKLEDAGSRKPRMLGAQGIFVAEGEPLYARGDVAFVFPGQGSQYVGMLEDLAEVYPVVRATFEEASEILMPLVGERLNDIVWPKVRDEAAELKLRQTQFCQPAMLTADVALYRLLKNFGVAPGRVAGHSLGEYAAAVAAGVLSFADALYAVSARGREMAGVEVADPGKMAVVAADAVRVESVLARAPGYVIAANKNCHTQTVLAGESKSVDWAMAQFAEMGVDARNIPVSHAFHSRIVAPAAKPLLRVLNNLTVNPPSIPFSSNVTAGYYPKERAAITELMASQLAAPVEFIGQIERLYEDGVRIFVEVGPKRAVTGFVRNILGTREHRALATNHPKKPAQQMLLEAIAALAADGVPVRTSDVPAASPIAENVPWAAPAGIDAEGPRGGTNADAAARPHLQDAIVISGTAVALPTAVPTGEDWREDLVGRLLAGENFIGTVDRPSQEAVLSRQVVRLNKASGSFSALNQLSDVIQLVGRMGGIDLTAYGLDKEMGESLDEVGRLVVACGIDALRDAGLPLIERFRTTSTGSQLRDRWALPPSLGKRMGIVVGSAFPGLEAIIDEVARHAASVANHANMAHFERFIHAWAGTLRDADEAGRLRAAFADHKSQAQSQVESYTFHRKWLFRALAMAHAQLAQVIAAQGPNTLVNAACASGPQAIAFATDWIKLKRCDRVVVVTADNVTHPKTLPWLGAGFLAAGAASTEPDLRQAAVPFGRGRNGMILGSGATAFILERKQDVLARGMLPIAEVLTTVLANSAFHGTRLDTTFIRSFFTEGVTSAAASLQTTSEELAKRIVFLSHETYTPARGGSAAAEVDALRAAFGPDVGDVLVANTKGATGHPMAGSFEDLVAVKGLQRGTMPAVANLHDIDPAFGDLSFSRGGNINRDISMRFGAGFGSQVALVVYRRIAHAEARLFCPETYRSWLTALGVAPTRGLEIVGRTLRVASEGEGERVETLGISSLCRTQEYAPTEHAPTEFTATPKRTAPLVSASHHIDEPSATERRPQKKVSMEHAERSETPAPAQSLVAPKAAPASHAASSSIDSAPGPNRQTQQQIENYLVEIFGEHTGYSKDELDVTLALEADLGIDTVKQAEVWGLVRLRYGLPLDPTLRLADTPTLRAMAERLVRTQPAAADLRPTAPPLSPVSIPDASAILGSRDVSPAASSNTSAASPAEPQATSYAAMLDELVALFAEQTGYAPNELEATHELEADLGIDTVKQAEILALVRKKRGQPLDESFKLGEHTTLASLARYFSAATPAKATPAAEKTSARPAASSPKEAAQTSVMPDVSEPQDFLLRLTTLFAEATGYAPDELHPDHQLESDLGIDTVKQAETFAEIRTQYGLPLDPAFRLAEVQTLRQMADYVARQVVQQASPMASAPEAKAAKISEAAPSPAEETPAPQPNFVGIGSVDEESFTARRVQLVAVTAPEGATDDLRGRRVILAGGDMTARRSFRQVFMECGANVITLEIPARAPGLARAPAYETRLGQMDIVPEDLLLFVAGDVARPDALSASAGELFALARTWAQLTRGAPSGGLLVVGRAGGGFGMRPARAPEGAFVGDLALQGVSLASISGAVKSLAREWSSARCMTLDVSGTPAEMDWYAVAHRAAGAWNVWHTAQNMPRELAWLDGQYWTLGRAPEATDPKPVLLSPMSRVFVTGGARGVTYELVRALCEARPLSLTILARTEPQAPASSVLAGKSGDAQKSIAQAALKAENRRVTPVAVRAWIEREASRIESYENLARLRALGSEVTFVACDVSRPEALGQALEHLQSGPLAEGVDLFVHGAGIEQSKRIGDKELSAFTETFAPKVDAFFTIWRSLRPSRSITMGSVAGRFGNDGQVDYAAANEALAGLSRQPHNRIVNIAWTAWGEVGMATRGQVRRMLESQGVRLLPRARGVFLGCNLIDSLETGDFVVAGELGAMDQGEHVGRDPVAKPSSSFPATSLFQSEATLASGGTSFGRTFSPDEDRGLNDHRIAEICTLPGVVGLEMMVQAASQLLAHKVFELEDVVFFAPVKFFHDKPLEVRVEAEVREFDVQLKVVSFFASPNGQLKRREHFSARTRIQAKKPRLLPQTLLPISLARGDIPERGAVYARYFHGPLFQVIENITELGDNGASAKTTPVPAAWLHHVDHASGASFAPWVEAAFQTAGLWEMHQLARMALPSAIAKIRFADAAIEAAGASVHARVERLDKQGATFSLTVRNHRDEPQVVIDGYRSIVTGPLLGHEQFADNKTPKHSPSTVARRLFGEVAEATALLEENRALPEILSPTEEATLAGLSFDKRRQEWLAGRLAAKRLTREVLFAETQKIYALPEIEVVTDGLGAPHLKVTNQAALPHLSISHRGALATALLARGALERCGIDLEEVEPRDISFGQTFFSTEEQAEIAASSSPVLAVTERWAVKEAVLKALGIGARVDLRDIQTRAEANMLKVTLTGEAAQHEKRLGGREWSIALEKVGSLVVAEARLRLGADSVSSDDSAEL